MRTVLLGALRERNMTSFQLLKDVSPLREEAFHPQGEK